MLVYFVISSILTGKIKRIVPAEVLKNREWLIIFMDGY